MAKNKGYSIREVIIDRCLSGLRAMTINEILDKVNEELGYLLESPIKDRGTIWRDLKNIEAKWHIIIEEIKIGRKTYYKYSDPKFSIYKAPLSLDEMQKLNQTLDLLKDFTGLPYFDWIDVVNARISDTIYTNIKSQPIVSFERNPAHAQSMKHFAKLFDIIISKNAIDLTYKKFNSEHETTRTIHPYHLKEYEGRWYLVCSVDTHLDSLSCYGLDRIINYSLSEKSFHPNTKFNILEYFDSMVGLTINNNTELEEVLIWVANNEYPYIQTKPIHKSQEYVEDKSGGKIIRLKLYLNYELEMRILSYGEKVKVLAPKDFYDRIKSRIDMLTRLYAPEDPFVIE